MARQHGGDLYDFSQMTDDEIRQIIVQHLREYQGLDADWIDVLVKDGFVTLSGRVGTDGEYKLAEAIVDDVLGIDDYSNELMVDELHRGEAPAGADEAATREDETEDPLGGGGNLQQSDTADHLQEHPEQQAFGTHDMGAAIREGMPYTPPDSPVPDGYDSRENH